MPSPTSGGNERTQLVSSRCAILWDICDRGLFTDKAGNGQGSKELPKKFIAVYTFLEDGRKNRNPNNYLNYLDFWWAHQGSNLGPAD